MSIKTLENRTLLPDWLDEGAPGQAVATLRSCTAPSGGGRGYSGGDWAAKIGIPHRRQNV